jgi:hypothetical protein
MTPSELRLQLRRNGYAPLPLIGKAPSVMKNWQAKTDTNAQEIALWASTWPDATNTGALTRLMPTLDLDIYNEEAVRAAEEIVHANHEEHGHVLVRIGKAPKRAIPFQTNEPFRKILVVLIAPNGAEEKIEFLGDGQQIAVAGMHPDVGQPYRWHGGNLWQIAREELPYIREAEARALVDEIVESLCRDFGYRRATERPKQSKGNGHDTAGSTEGWEFLLDNIREGRALHDSLLKLGAKLRASGMGSGAIVNLLKGLMQTSTTPHDARWQDRFDSISRLVAGAEQFAPTAEPLFDPWERYIVPEFPMHILPQTVRDYVASQSVIIGCDPSALAMAALTAFSGALDHRFAVKMMQYGNWWEHPRLWTLLVGDPSRKKTPIINDVARPLERHQIALRRSYEIALQAYEAAKENGDNTVEKPDPPVRYVVWDTTTEKLGEILSRSQHGLLVKRDEFSGWIGGMEKYGSGSRAAGADRGFWLQAFDGGPHAVDRIGRGETYINNLSVSLIGGIQPAKLIELQGLTSDGLLQRFLPVMMRASSFASDCECGDDQENYQSLVHKLIRAPHQRLLLCDRALTLLTDLRKYLHHLEQTADARADGLQAFIGKLPGIAGRLAVILHMAANPENASREIAAITIAHVDTLIKEFILPHAVEFYRSTEELTGGERLRKIASWILTSGQTTVTSRDLVRNVACLRGLSVPDLNTYVSPLVAAGWLEPAAPGAFNRTWTVSPKVAAQFERQRQAEEHRKLPN